MTLWERWQAVSPHAKGITILAGTAAAVFGAITAIATAWPIVEPIIPAHRGFVVQTIGDKVEDVQKGVRRSERRMIEGQIETVEVRRSLVDKESFELEMMLANPAIQEPVRGTLGLRKRALDDDRKNLDFRLDQLQRTQTGRRP